MVDFNGFDKGVIGKKLPSDTTLNSMRKADLIKLLHLAESNHRVLAETYKIAIDTSKCNHCPLSIDTRRAEQIRAEVIDEFAEDIINKINFEEKWLFDAKSYNKDTDIAFSALKTFVKSLTEKVKEQNK